MNIVLLGYCGSGKMAVGKKLADQLWGSFVDVDEVTAAQVKGAAAGSGEYLSAAQEQQGKLLANLKPDGEPVVVAASSVAAPDKAAAESLKAHCRFVYLKAEPQVLAKRIAEDPARTKGQKKPSCSTEAADVAAAVSALDPMWTSLADLTLDTSPMTIETVIRLIVRMAM